MDYQKFLKLSLYLYNRVDYEKFFQLFQETFGNVSNAYVKEKWELFKRGPVDFLLTFRNKKFFDNVQKHIKNENYEG